MTALSEQVARYRGARQRLMGQPVRLNGELQAAIEAKEQAETVASVLFFALTTRVVQKRRIGSPALTRKIIAEVARAYSIDPAQILAYSHERRISEARHVAMYLMRAMGRSLTQLGEDIGRDRTTAIYAVRKIEQRINADQAFAAAVEKIRQSIEKALLQ